ncbi:hypothetical protein ACF0H5_012991 [Mactra antiquata]
MDSFNKKRDSRMLPVLIYNQLGTSQHDTSRLGEDGGSKVNIHVHCDNFQQPHAGSYRRGYNPTY